MLPKSILGKASFVIAFSFVLLPFLLGNAAVIERLGYLGFFIASYFGAAGYLLLPAFLLSLDPVLLTVIGAFGLTIDEFFAWYAGKTSDHEYKSDHKLHVRIKSFIAERGLLAIFCLGLLPLPGIIYAVSGYTAGHFKIPFWRYFVANYLGKLIRTALVVTLVSLAIK